MTIQFSTALRNAMVDALESATGTAPSIRLRTGPQPANCAAADSGTVVISYTLTADWSAAAVNGVKTFNGPPVATGPATGQGTIAHYRVYAANGTTCHMQGNVTVTGGGGDMTCDNINANVGQAVTIDAWTMTAPHP
jgi:hypothetical protein